MRLTSRSLLLIASFFAALMGTIMASSIIEIPQVQGSIALNNNQKIALSRQRREDWQDDFAAEELGNALREHQGMNIMVFDRGHKYHRRVHGMHREYDRQFEGRNYGVHVFRCGEFENRQMGKNWAFGGCYERDGWLIRFFHPECADPRYRRAC